MNDQPIVTFGQMLILSFLWVTALFWLPLGLMIWCLVS